MALLPASRLYDMDRFFDDVWGRLPSSAEEGEMTPRVNVKEKNGNYLIEAELPGVKKEDIDVSLENGMLTITATMEEEDKEEKEGRYIRRERRFGQYVRSFRVGDAVTEKDIKANFKDGILKLDVPRKEAEKPKAKHISIQ